MEAKEGVGGGEKFRFGNEAARAKWKKKNEPVRPRTYPKTPRTIYHAQRAQQEVRLGMLMWAAGAGSQCACATPRGANHRPRNGSCARSQLVGHHNLGKMEEESLGWNSNFSLFLLLLRLPLCSVPLSFFLLFLLLFLSVLRSLCLRTKTSCRPRLEEVRREIHRGVEDREHHLVLPFLCSLTILLYRLLSCLIV